MKMTKQQQLLLLVLHSFNGLFSRSTSRGKPAPEKQNHSGKTNLDLLEQEIVSGSDISWVMCKSAPRSRQITMPAPHHLVFYRSDALPAAQPTVSKHWKQGNDKTTCLHKFLTNSVIKFTLCNLHYVINYVTYSYISTGFWLGLPGWAGTRKEKPKPIWISRCRRQWVAVVSAGPCANLHFTPDKDNHADTPPLSSLQAGCPYCHPMNSVKALKA